MHLSAFRSNSNNFVINQPNVIFLSNHRDPVSNQGSPATVYNLSTIILVTFAVQIITECVKVGVTDDKKVLILVDAGNVRYTT